MNRRQSTIQRDLPKIAWLADDFTGAAAVMEVLTFSGIPSILFLDLPTRAQIDACAGIGALGIATLARAHSPDWMAANLPPLFAFLDTTGAELIHYKICSTLDSSPETGSIGKAIELALDHFGAATVPVVTAAPLMRRYQAFGTLFCGAGDEVHRLDRHPVMARHPVTPMHEADVALHLAGQTNTPTRCLNLEQLSEPASAAAFLANGPLANICTFDCVDARHETAIGKLLWDRRKASRFVVGSQGIEYALVAHFRATGALAGSPPPDALDPDPRMAVVSGSVSATTANQIAWARANGFETIRVELGNQEIDENARRAAETAAVDAALAALSAGKCPLLFTAEGPDDPAIARLRASDADPNATHAAVGRALGRILRNLIAAANLTRVVVSGGDTSGHVCRALDIHALEAATPTVPGAAICRARSATDIDGLEIALKGGQMGTPDYFGWVRDGGGERQ